MHNKINGLIIEGADREFRRNLIGNGDIFVMNGYLLLCVAAACQLIENETG